MKRIIFLPLTLLLLTGATAAPPMPKPRLILIIVVDQLRYDYLTRFDSEYRGGLPTLISKGAVFTNARFEHFPAVTAVGHSTIMTGATPSISGIIANDWYDRDAGKRVTSVSDDAVGLLGTPGEAGASPRRLLVSTVGDELKMARGSQCKVIGVSLKDRSAILTAGHMADAAYWYHSKSGRMVSSTFYMAELPAWVQDFNKVALERFRGAEWLGRKLPADEKLPGTLPSSPFGNELLAAFAEQVIEKESLGKDEAPDLFSISFSSNDVVGHSFGPDSPEVREMCIQTDRILEKLFRFVDGRIGMKNVLVVLTGDHGVAPTAEAQAARRMPGGRMPARAIQDTVQAALAGKYGDGKWILSTSEHSIYLNYELMRERNLDRDAVARAARNAVVPLPHIFRVYTREQLAGGAMIEDQVARRVMNGYMERRGADLMILLEPYWIFGSSGTTHGSAFGYDLHVPLILMGPWIKAGRYHRAVPLNDLAPTLATILEIETPSGSAGHVLVDCLAER